MSQKRKPGTPRTDLHVEIHPDNWDWLWKFSRERQECMGRALDTILEERKRSTSLRNGNGQKALTD